MKFKLTLISLMGFFFLNIENLKAQTTTADLTMSHLQAAENFLIVTGINTKFPAVVESIVDAFSKQVPEGEKSAFASVMRKFMNKYYTWDILKPNLDKIYAAEFTEDELKQMTDFYNSPVGKKYSEKSVLLMQKGMQIGQEVMMNHKPELEQMIKEAMPEKN